MLTILLCVALTWLLRPAEMPRLLRGLPFVASYHITPATALEAIDAYRDAFVPSATCERPYVVVSADIVVAEHEGAMVGFVTVLAKNRYLDQIVVAPESWSSGLAETLLAEARRLSPAGLTLHVNKDNSRALRFYEKHGFVIQGGDVNPNSGRPVYKMSWRP